MARGRREIKKIEDKNSRQVTFSKRRAGLFKKAKELALLCDATIALFTFSTAGKLFQYSTTSMKMIIDKYVNYPQLVGCSISSRSNNNLYHNHMELEKMKQLWEDRTRICRQMGGADLEGLDFKQLEELEDGLQRGLKRIKSRKDKLRMMQIQRYLQRQSELTQENRNLEAHSGQRQLEMPCQCQNQRSNDHHHNGENEDSQDNLTSLQLGLPDTH